MKAAWRVNIRAQLEYEEKAKDPWILLSFISGRLCAGIAKCCP